MKIRIICSMTASDTNSGLLYAFLELDYDKVKKWLELIEASEKVPTLMGSNDDFVDVRFFNRDPSFVDDLGEDIDDADVDDGSWCRVTGDLIGLEDEDTPTIDTSIMIVNESSICWEVNTDHDIYTYCSPLLEKSMLQGIFEELRLWKENDEKMQQLKGKK